MEGEEEENMTRRINQTRTNYNVDADLARQAKEARAAKKRGVVVYDRDAGIGEIPRNLKPLAERKT